MRAGLVASLIGLAVATASPTAAAAPGDDDDRPKVQLGGLSISPMLRFSLRPEARVNAGEDDNPNGETSKIAESIRVGLRANYKALTVVGQFHDVRDWGLGRKAVSGVTGVYQSYLEVGGDKGRLSGFLRIGRQEVKYGSHRHFHAPKWSLIGRALDAVRGQIHVGRFSAEAMYAMLSIPKTFDVTDANGQTTQVKTVGQHVGLFDIGYDFHEAAQLHAAVIVKKAGPEADAPDLDRFFVMPGGRLTGELAQGLSYQAEGWVQTGHDGSRRRLAWMGAAGGEYTAPIKAKPGLRALYEISSGGQCTGNPRMGQPCGAGVSRDFDQLNGARHYYRGHMDLMAGSNLRDLAITPFVQPAKDLRIEVAYHFFQLDAASGPWYRSNGTSVWGDGWTPGFKDHNLGQEVDFDLRWKPWKYLMISPGYGIFIKGPAARQLLPPEPIHFVFLWFLAEF